MSERDQPRLWARVSPEEMADIQDAAKTHYDGNVSLMVRVAVKRFLSWLAQTPDIEPKDEVAA